MDLTGISSVFDLGSKILDRVWPDPATRDAAKLELFKATQAGEFKEMDQAFELAKGQIDVNKVEAASSSVFVSGARPFIMWTCGVGLGMQFIVSPLVTWGAALFGKTIVLPPLDMGTLLTLLMGMLGLSGMRTVEKLNGVARTTL